MMTAEKKTQKRASDQIPMDVQAWVIAIAAILVFVILGWLMITPFVQAQTVILDGDGRDWKVERIELSSEQAFACPRSERIFSPYDYNENGELDDWCIGVEYNPCEFHSLQRAIYLQAVTGGCRDLDDLARQRAREEACNGFSPRPTYCDE